MKPNKDELKTINSRLPGTSVKADQVEILPFRLFDNQVTDRGTVMTPEMMNKLVFDANNGSIAFNSLHQSRSTLPVGRSVSGTVQTDGNNKNLLVKMYAVTQRPDGTPMEDGKDLADKYNTGAVYAVSAGVTVGFYKCSICGNDIRDYQNCDHFPGEVYQVDEKPVVALAYMTGHDIQNGMAMDCGCYEASAVTAGGVKNASILSETFGRYDKTSDLKEFKANQFKDKDVLERVTLTPYMANTTREEEQMADNEKSLIDKHYELIEQKAKTEVTLATLQGEFNTLKVTADTTAKTLESTVAEFAKVKEDSITAFAKVEEFSKKITDLEAAAVVATTEFTTKLEEATAKATAAEAFKNAYVAIVEADGVKISATVADYASKTLEELQTLHTEYLAKIAELPSGQQTLGTGEDTVIPTVYTGIPEEFYKVR